MTVAIEPGGMEARARGLEFGMLGEADKGTAFYTLAIFENRYVKQNDIWRIREMRIFPLMKTDYAQGWAKSQVVDPPPAKEHAPDRPVPASDVMTPGAIPVFFAPNPATGKPVSLPSGAKTVGRERLLPAPAARSLPRRPAIWTRASRKPSGGSPSRKRGTAPRTCRRPTATISTISTSAAREAVRREGQQGDSVQRLLRGAREHRQARRDVAAARIAPADDAAPSLADAAGDPRRQRWTLRVHPLAPLPAGLEPHPRHGLRRRHVSRSGRARRRRVEAVERHDRRALLLVADVRRRLVVGEGSRAAPRRRRARGGTGGAARQQLSARHPSHHAGGARAGLPRRHRRDDHLARNPADVVPLQEPRQRTRPRNSTGRTASRACSTRRPA